MLQLPLLLLLLLLPLRDYCLRSAASQLLPFQLALRTSQPFLAQDFSRPSWEQEVLKWIQPWPQHRQQKWQRKK